jgi:hypothetical protein
VVDTEAGPIRELPPFAYQHVDGKRIAVAAHFKLDGKNRVGFTVASYQHGRPLVIDPPVLCATYLGGIHDDDGQSVAIDAAGNSYVAGFTASTAFPVSATAFQTARAEVGQEIYNAFVTKLSPAGAIIYSTFVGGTPDKSGTCGSTPFVGDCAEGIAVDTAGNAYVTGSTASSDFPITPASAFQPAFGGGNSDAFLFELSPDGSHLVYSTFFGGDNSEGGVGSRPTAADMYGSVGRCPEPARSRAPQERFSEKSRGRTTALSRSSTSPRWERRRSCGRRCWAAQTQTERPMEGCWD